MSTLRTVERWAEVEAQRLQQAQTRARKSYDSQRKRLVSSYESEDINEAIELGYLHLYGQDTRKHEQHRRVYRLYCMASLRPWCLIEPTSLVSARVELSTCTMEPYGAFNRLQPDLESSDETLRVLLLLASKASRSEGHVTIEQVPHHAAAAVAVQLLAYFVRSRVAHLTQLEAEQTA